MHHHNSPYEEMLVIQRRLEARVEKLNENGDYLEMKHKASHIANVLSCLVHYANKGERIPDNVRDWLHEELNEI